MRKSNKLSDWHFKRLINKEDPKKIIGKHIRNEITLSSKQLDECIRRKYEKGN